MNLFSENLICDELESGYSGSSLAPGTAECEMNSRPFALQGRHVADLIHCEVDEEWSTPLAKISRLYYDHESWAHAREILEAPSPGCKKVGDEARGLASRYVIDRLQEKQYLEQIQNVAPQLRSAVELLSKPDADYLYPPVQFVVNELRSKYPQVYDSVVGKIGIRIPEDMKPKTVVVTISKRVFENVNGDVENNWGKFVSLLGLCGALAVDSVEAGYPEGVTEVVDTFGLVVEHIMGEWILSEGGGWEGFIQQNQYEPILSPIPRTVVIVSVVTLVLYLFLRIIVFFYFFFYENGSRRGSDLFRFRQEMECQAEGPWTCLKPRNPAEYLYFLYYYA